MKVFLDANILVTVLNKEYPLFPYAAKILSLADQPPYQLYTSPICLAIAFYFAEKKSGRQLAKKKIGLLAGKIKMATADEKVVALTLSNKAVLDFEDGLEYYSAELAGCKCLLTEDADDFFFAKMDVLAIHEFVTKFLTRNN